MLSGILASILGGIALASYEIYKLDRVTTAADAIASAVAAGLGGGTVSSKTVTTSVQLCFGLIPVGRVEHPRLVTAVGNLLVGTIITGCLLFLLLALRRVTRRKAPLSGPDQPRASASP